MVNLFDKILRAGEGRELRRLEAIAQRVGEAGDVFSELTDDELRAETDHFKERLEEGETLDKFTVAEAEDMLKVIQGFDPAGLGGSKNRCGSVVRAACAERRVTQWRGGIGPRGRWIDHPTFAPVMIVADQQQAVVFPPGIEGRVFVRGTGDQRSPTTLQRQSVGSR